MDNNPHFEIVCDVFLYSLFLLVSFACINLKKNYEKMYRCNQQSK